MKKLIVILAAAVAAMSCSHTELIMCGSSMLYKVDAAKALKAGSYEDALIWKWDIREHCDELGLPLPYGTNIDDCKPVDGGKRILVTSSADWTAIVDGETGHILFHTALSINAHSSELLPGGYLAVACSTRGDCIQLYDVNRSEELLFSTPFTSAHGLVWSGKYERLFAIGGELLNIYRFSVDVDGNPSLELESSTVSPIVHRLHELSVLDDDTLVIAGVKACYYHIATGEFEEIPMFSASNQVKSVNMHSRKGVWFTDATFAEGRTWSTKTARWADDLTDTVVPVSETNIPGHTFRVEDIDMYKIRVCRW